MKNLTLINNVWIERKKIELTPEEKSIIDNKNKENAELRNATLIDLRSRAMVTASTEDSATAQTIYDQHKLDNANLISVDINLPSGKGIINCRLNGDHKQIRF
jgi:siroheme synthase (precorrin-2 oxidase/ferrochelatase)